MPTTVAIIWLKDGQTTSTPKGFPTIATVEANEWRDVTDKMVEKDVGLRLKRRGLQPPDGVEFAYAPL